MKRIVAFTLVLLLILSAVVVIRVQEPKQNITSSTIEKHIEGTRATLHVGPSQTYSTIGAAITASITGDTIRVHAKTYYENVVIPVSKTLYLVGDGAGLSIIDGSGITDTVAINSNGCTVQGFTIQNSNSGYNYAGVHIYSDRNLIKDCNITDNAQGIYLDTASNNTIENCTVYYNYYNGVYSPSGSFTSTYSYGFETAFPPTGWTSYTTAYSSAGRTTSYTPNSGSYHYIMCSTADTYAALNEITYHYAGGACTSLSFWEKNPGGYDELITLPATWSGHYNGDGVGISDDGINWIYLWSAAGGTTYTQHTYTPALYITDDTDFYVRFQQYDDYTWGTDGRCWDDIQFDSSQTYRNSDNRIYNSTSHYNGDDGISLSESDMTRIYNCTVSNNDWDGIYLYCCQNTKVKDCRISANTNGMYFSRSDGSWLYNNDISNNAENGIDCQAYYYYGFEGNLPSGWAAYNDTGYGRNIRTSQNWPNTGSYQWQMDSADTSGSYYTLNELTYHHTMFEASTLMFYENNTAEDMNYMSSYWTGDDYSDGVGASLDGTNWQGIWQGPGNGMYTLQVINFTAGIGTSLYLRFQQYDNYNTPTDGMFWDDIQLIRCNNDNVIQDNYINKNGMTGIQLYGFDNLFFNNTVSNHPGLAMNITGMSNGIYHNNFINNKPGLKQASDFGPYNAWDDGAKGNYWSDWTAPDVDKNGIVDVAYQFAGFKSPKDRYPLTTPFNGPRITTADVNSTLEDALYQVNYAATDANTPAGALKWTLKTNAAWLSLNGGSTITGTPGNSEVGTYWVNISVKDALFADFHNFTLVVINVNDPPQITSTPILPSTEDSVYTSSFTAIDIDPTADVLTWSVRSNATFLSIDPTSGVLSGTPDNSQVGLHWVNVTVSDGNAGTGYHNFTITVANVNDAPIILGPDDTETDEDALYKATYSATDPDPTGDILTWSLVGNASWLSIGASNGTIWGTPTNDEVGIYTVNITVKDNLLASSSREFILTVLNTNDAPWWMDSPKDANLSKGDVFTFDANATDMDLGDVLHYSIVTSQAIGLLIDADTGVITWTANAVGKYKVNISATDSFVLIYHEFYISVFESLTNKAPTATLTSPLNNSELDVLNPTLTWTASDLNGDPITVSVYLSDSKASVESLLNSALEVSDLATASFDTAPLTKGTTYYWTVIPDDGLAVGVCSSGIWSFKIKDSATVNHLPIFITLPFGEAGVGKEWTYEPAATDEDEDIVTLSLISGPAGMAMSSGKLSWTPTISQLGTHNVTISASDGKGETLQTFFVSVTTAGPTNKAPTIESIVNEVVKEGQLVSVQVKATDPDSDNLTYSITTGPKDMGISSSGLITWLTKVGDVGNYTVVVKVTDSKFASASVSFRVQVKAAGSTDDDDDDDAVDDDVDHNITDDDDTFGGYSYLYVCVIPILAVVFLIIVIVFVIILVVARRKKERQQKKDEPKKDVLEPEIEAPSSTKPTKTEPAVKAQRMEAGPAAATASKTTVSPPPTAPRSSARSVPAPSPKVQLQRWGADSDNKKNKDDPQALLPPASQESPEGMDAGPDLHDGPDVGEWPDAGGAPGVQDGPDTSLPTDETPKDPAKEEIFKW